MPRKSRSPRAAAGRFAAACPAPRTFLIRRDDLDFVVQALRCYGATRSVKPLAIIVPSTRRRNVSSLNPVWTRSPMKMPINVIGSVIANINKTSRL